VGAPHAIEIATAALLQLGSQNIEIARTRSNLTVFAVLRIPMLYAFAN